MSCLFVCFFFFKQKTAYEMRISDWSSDVCSSDLRDDGFLGHVGPIWERVDEEGVTLAFQATQKHANLRGVVHGGMLMTLADRLLGMHGRMRNENRSQATVQLDVHFFVTVRIGDVVTGRRTEEHRSETPVTNAHFVCRLLLGKKNT